MFSPIICRWLSYCFTLDPSTNSPFTRPSKRWSWSPLAVMADPSWWTCRDPTVGTKRGAPNQLKSSSLINPVAANQWVIWKLAKLNNTANSVAFQGGKKFLNASQGNLPLDFGSNTVHRGLHCWGSSVIIHSWFIYPYQKGPGNLQTLQT